MSFFKNMELPEVLIIVSLTALPFVGWWISVEVDAIDKARRAVSANTRAGGNIESVGELQEQIELVEDNRRTTGADAQNPGTYFELQLTESDSARRLQADDYKISNQKPRPGQIGKGREKQLVTDYEVDITFQKKGDKKDYTMNREFLFAMLFNCESGARRDTAPLPPIWKLRNLTLTNALVEPAWRAKSVPPQPLEDAWIIKKLQFARREPRKRN